MLHPSSSALVVREPRIAFWSTTPASTIMHARLQGEATGNQSEQTHGRERRRRKKPDFYLETRLNGVRQRLFFLLLGWLWETRRHR